MEISLKENWFCMFSSKYFTFKRIRGIRMGCWLACRQLQRILPYQFINDSRYHRYQTLHHPIPKRFAIHFYLIPGKQEGRCCSDLLQEFIGCNKKVLEATHCSSLLHNCSYNFCFEACRTVEKRETWLSWRQIFLFYYQMYQVKERH